MQQSLNLSPLYLFAHSIVLHLSHFTTALTLRLVIISLRPAWLARVLLSFKRTQSSGND